MTIRRRKYGDRLGHGPPTAPYSAQTAGDSLPEGEGPNAVRSSAATAPTGAIEAGWAPTGRAQNLLEVQDLHVHFPLATGALPGAGEVVKAVDGVSFAVKRGEIFGLVGESGSGKTTVGRAILRLAPITAGTVSFDGVDTSTLHPREIRRLRRRMQMVFQDPISSLNPRVNVGNAIAFPMQVLGMYTGAARDRRIAELLELVGMPARVAAFYPHELSSGDRQRVGIARAISVNPDFLFLDEPVASLDVSMQAQVLNLLRAIREELRITMLFVSHNLAVVEHICDRVAVMYLGKFCEVATAQKLYRNAGHPYTIALTSAISHVDIEAGAPKEIILKGEIPSPIEPPTGCRFHTRCFARFDDEIHETVEPRLQEIAPGHLVACHLYPQPGRARIEERS